MATDVEPVMLNWDERQKDYSYLKSEYVDNPDDKLQN